MSPTPSVPRSVLVVDDDTQISQLICAALILIGAKPVNVDTFGAALVELRHGHSETVLLDLALPDSAPAATLKSIPFLLSRGAGQIIVITGSEITEELRDFAIQSGAHSVLCKDGDMFGKISAIIAAGRSFKA